MFDRRSFFAVKEEDSRLRLIREGAKTQAPALLWTAGKPSTVRATLTHFDFAKRRFHVGVSERVDPRKILELIADPQGILFQVELGRVKLMFRTLLGHYDQGKPVIEFQIPDQIYKVQQRKEPRVSTRDIAGLHGSHEDPHLPEKRISRKILDLSEGGVSLKIFVGEDRHYQVGKQFQELQIQLPESFFQCLGQVQNIRLVKLSENESEMVMGIKFVSLSEENRIKIQNFIQSRVMQEFGEMMIPMPSTDNPSPSKI